jgi:hypothetical protein
MSTPCVDRLDGAACPYRRDRSNRAGPTPPPHLHGRCRRATPSPWPSPVSSLHRRCGRSTSATAAAHRSVFLCAGFRRAPPKLVVYPTVAAPPSGRVHNAGESPSAPSCARVAAASLPLFPRRLSPSSLQSTLSAPLPSRRRRREPSPCTASLPRRHAEGRRRQWSSAGVVRASVA